ncbi:ISL3 family transposase [Bacillus testis]|uniref:ISL3 family transposase n=1 Tax=Bacillus testis TaxID=1622072 RepID=UPI0009E6163D|nr:ISL3 family transposase [Bacillus testis]
MLLHFNMILPGLEGATIIKTDINEGIYQIYIEMPIKDHACPSCSKETKRVHDYRIQKIKHLKMAERPTMIIYRKRRYACLCGKRFYEENPFVERYQHHSKEWNQQVQIRTVKAKTFTEIAAQYHTSVSTIIRRFDRIIPQSIKGEKALPKAIAIDEFKGDSGKEKYQLIIANAVTREPIDILPNRRKDTIKEYLRKHGAKVEVVVMDMSHAFKAAVKQALDGPVIVADGFHFVRYMNWALDKIRVREQNEWHAYDRKKCKKVRYVFHKASHKLTKTDKWYLERYFALSPELKIAYGLKEAFYEWFNEAKRRGPGHIEKTKEALHAFYEKVEESRIPEFVKTVQTYRNWETEILNRFEFGYSNGFVEGLNNLTKVMKRNAFGFRNFARFRARILLHHHYKSIGNSVG